MQRSLPRRLVFAAIAATAAALPLGGCSDYDVPGADRPWPKLNDFPERPDAQKMEARRLRLLGKYGRPEDALPKPTTVPDRPPDGALRVAVVQFERAGQEPGGPAMGILEQVAAYAQQSRATVWLFGYTSRKVELASGGSARDSSQALAAGRVRAVALALVKAGVPPERIRLIARGAHDPVYLETAETGEAGNRRVEIWFTR